MEVFTQFSSDLDEATKRQLTYGQGLMRLLRQPQYHPMKQHEQVITLVAALGHVMQNLTPDQIPGYQHLLVETAQRQNKALCQRIDQGVLSDDDRQEIMQLARDCMKTYLETLNAEEKCGD